MEIETNRSREKLKERGKENE
jgi:hypothetical protein